MRIASFIPTYSENVAEIARCLRYLGEAERFAQAREPSWEFVSQPIYGRKVGDGHAWSAERDRETARVRDLGWAWARDTEADRGVSLDSDLMVNPDLFTKLVYLGQDFRAKTIQVWNVETGRFRFVEQGFKARYTLEDSPRVVHYASELMALDREAMKRLPHPYYRDDKLNEDYELCDVIRGMGYSIYAAPVDGVAT